VALIPVKDITALTGYVRGGVSPLGMKKTFPTVIDSRAAAFPTVIISGGRLGAQILLDPQDLARAVNARLPRFVRNVAFFIFRFL